MPPVNNRIGSANPVLLIHKAIHLVVFSIFKIFDTPPKLSSRDVHNDQNITDLRKRANMTESDKPITAFVNLNELPEESRTCELCENHFSILELNGAPGYAIYPVRLLCGHIFCYDCARMWITHAKCPECDARFTDHAIALEAIDEQIRQYRQYQVACFNARLQAGMIRAPPGYPTFAGQQVGPSRWWHEDDATLSDGLSAPSEVPSIEVTNPEGYATGLKRDVAANGIPNVDDDDGETFAINKSEQTPKEFRIALGLINKVSGTNYSRGDFPNLKLKYERKPR